MTRLTSELRSRFKLLDDTVAKRPVHPIVKDFDEVGHEQSNLAFSLVYEWKSNSCVVDAHGSGTHAKMFSSNQEAS